VLLRFWASLAQYNQVTGRFEIKGVMGPDEFHEAYPGAKEGGLFDVRNDLPFFRIIEVYVSRIE